MWVGHLDSDACPALPGYWGHVSGVTTDVLCPASQASSSEFVILLLHLLVSFWTLTAHFCFACPQVVSWYPCHMNRVVPRYAVVLDTVSCTPVFKVMDKPDTYLTRIYWVQGACLMLQKLSSIFTGTQPQPQRVCTQARNWVQLNKQ